MSEDKDLELDDTLEEPLEVITGDEEELPDYDTLLAQKKELEAKYKKVDGARLHYKTKLEKLSEKQTEAKPQANQQPAQNNTDIERLSLEVKGYSDDEIDFIMQYGGKKSLENPIVKLGIEKYREDKRNQEATQIKSSGGTSGDKLISDEKLKDMSADDIEKAIKAGKVKTE